MAYVDESYYTESFQGEAVDEAALPGLIVRAEELVEELTLYRLTPLTFSAMPEETQELIRKAICAQVEYMDANGGAEMDMGAGLASASLGGFSYSRAASGSGSTEQSVFAPRAERILWQTGLTYRGGCV